MSIFFRLEIRRTTIDLFLDTVGSTPMILAVSCEVSINGALPVVLNIAKNVGPVNGRPKGPGYGTFDDHSVVSPDSNSSWKIGNGSNQIAAVSTQDAAMSVTVTQYHWS